MHNSTEKLRQKLYPACSYKISDLHDSSLWTAEGLGWGVGGGGGLVLGEGGESFGGKSS